MKDTMQLVNTHRKCMKCNSTILDLEKDRCSCGAYMHLVGFVYQPVIHKTDVKQQVQAS